MNEFEPIADGWISIRDRFPFQRAKYLVYDCVDRSTGIAKYNGFDFYDVKWEINKKGNLLLKINKISHWIEI